MARALSDARAAALVGRIAAASTSAVACAASPRAFHGAWRAWARSRVTGDKSAMVGRYGERLPRASQRQASRAVGEELHHDAVELRRLLVVWQHPRRIEDGQPQLGVDREEAPRILDRSLDGLLTPDQHHRLAKTPHRTPDVEVEMSGQKR